MSQPGNTSHHELKSALFVVNQALEADENGNVEEALKLYSQAVEMCIAGRKICQTDETALLEKFGKLASQAMDRAEDITKSKLKSVHGVEKSSMAKPISESSRSVSQYSYSADEKRVLALTSLINGREFLPFLADVDAAERFEYPMPFTDKDGFLTLAPKQRNRFSHWVRLDALSAEPSVICRDIPLDCLSVKQTIVSDCSFVASIAVLAQYERKFGLPLISGLIYPRNRKTGKPIYNPCGKYMVRLRINGIPRKVIIDDFLPVDSSHKLLCSFSSNKNEFWVSLLEKAYMKVMGGYDFPGSNSNIDLYALTGWIPERFPIGQKQSDFKDDPNFINKDMELFEKLLDRFHRGDVLATFATGELSIVDADRAGLVATHAYALLDVRKMHNGIRLLKLKNPWSHLRWKGNFSNSDTRNWTTQLKQALNYEPSDATWFDNGVFWIDYGSVMKFFDVAYLNWNPSLFSHTSSMHHSWRAGVGPAKDLYDISSNPQYALNLSAASSGAIWILLTRHILTIEDFRENREFIALLVYDSSSQVQSSSSQANVAANSCQRIFYPYDPAPYMDGIRINSPHYLVRMVLGPNSPRRMTLVVSQYDKSTTIHYTLRVYSTLPFNLRRITPIREMLSSCVELQGRWKNEGSVRTAGGCANYPETYGNNPRYQFTTVSNTLVFVELKGPKEVYIGIDLICLSCDRAQSSSSSAELYFSKKSSGSYRSGFVVLNLTELLPGIYDIVPSTFKPGVQVPFFLTIFSSKPLKINQVK